MSPARTLRDARQQHAAVGPSRRPVASGRWTIILAVLAAVTIVSNSLLAQSTPPFAEQRHGTSQSTSPKTGPTARPNRSTQQPKRRFSDARPITPSGLHTASGDAGESRTSSVVPSVWKTFGTLAGIVAMIVIGGRLWKKHGPKLSGGLPAEAIEVLGKRNVDTRQAIYLVRLGSRILVLGSTANGLRTLAEVTDPVEVDYLAGLCHHRDAENSVAQSFRSLFSRQSVVEAASDSAEASAAIPFDRPEANEPDAISQQHAMPRGAHV